MQTVSGISTPFDVYQFRDIAAAAPRDPQD
jgi:hypothetical protein